MNTPKSELKTRLDTFIIPLDEAWQGICRERGQHREVVTITTGLVDTLIDIVQSYEYRHNPSKSIPKSPFE
jgi:hypothetical protein